MTTKIEKLGVRSHKYRTNKVTYLEINNKLICPICFQHKENWHVNHFVMQMDGGRNTKYNLTVLCAMCHRMLHDGEDEKRMFVYKRLNMFMMSRYGILGRKDILQKTLEKMNMALSISNVRNVHKTVKAECEVAYQDELRRTLLAQPTR